MRSFWFRLGLAGLSAAAFAPTPAPAQPLVAGKPADVGMSEVVLRAGAALFEEAIARDELRGAVLLVARRGRIVLHEGQGWRDAEGVVPMRVDSLFRMASNTKPVIAAARQ